MLSLKKANIDEFTEIYNNYMLKQFPQSELKSFNDFFVLLSDKTKSYELYLAYNEGINTGYTLFYKGENFIWVDYIAVLPEFYSHGFGKKLIEALCNTFKNIKGIYFEVEKPDEKDINTLRRIKFYTSNGARKIDCEYLYPNREGILPMDLYYLSVSGDASSKEEIFNDIKEVFKNLHNTNPYAQKALALIH